VDVVRVESAYDATQWKSYYDSLDAQRGPTAYLFKCRHCGKLGGYPDSHWETECRRVPWLVGTRRHCHCQGPTDHGRFLVEYSEAELLDDEARAGFWA